MTINDRTPPPSPERQLEFLANLQRLLSEGLFTSTYKFALLMALADLAVELGEDDGSPVLVRIDAIAEKFVFYYWGQTRPYVSPGTGTGLGDILLQNTGKQAAIISQIADLRASSDGSLAAAQRRLGDWQGLVRKVEKVVKDMPLWKLQTIGKEKHEFLYAQNQEVAGCIELKPGVGFCLRRFHSLVVDLVRGAWLSYVRRQNHVALGATVDLDEFLFGTSRAALKRAGVALIELQSRSCFYCSKAIADKFVVDHFVHWSRYSVDLGPNFVLAHPNCNRSKSDRIAALPHLERWMERNIKRERELKEALSLAGFYCDLSVSLRVTGWAYKQAATVGERGWVKGEELVEIGNEWRGILGIDA